MFKKLFPPFKINLLEPFLCPPQETAERWENGNSDAGRFRDGSETQSHEFREGSKVGTVNPLIPTHK